MKGLITGALVTVLAGSASLANDRGVASVEPGGVAALALAGVSAFGLYQYQFDIEQITELWRRGSVVSSWLLDLTAHALSISPGLDDFAGRVSDSGEGRWTAIAAIDEGVPTPVLSTALFERFSSRGQADFADRVLSAMRFEFGGHLEKPTPGGGGGQA